MNIAMLLSCGSFEGFFRGVLGQTRESYLQNYRNDWAWYYAAGLAQNGIAPTLYIPSLYEAGKYETDAGIAVRFLPLDRWYRPLENVWLKRLSRATPLSLYLEERLNTLAFMKPLVAGLAEDNIKLLYIQEYWSGRFDHIAHRVDVPVTAADHGGLSQGVLKWFKRQSFSKAAILFCQTRSECQIVEQYGGLAKLQPNGCDTRRFFPDPDAKRGKTILTVARLTNKQKRTTDLIRALSLLPQEWTLDIVGIGPDLGMLRRCADELEASSRVRFHGFLGADHVRDLLQACGVYVMPSANEAMAIAALEAMSCGAPVVLSRIRSFEHLIDDGVNGRLVPVGDVQGLASAILDAWGNRREWGAAAAETIRRHYDSCVLYKELADLLRIAAAADAPLHSNSAASKPMPTS